MGYSTDGIFAYGYDLGGDEEGWNFPGLDYGEWRPAEIEGDEEACDDFDFAEWVEAKLLVAQGFTETDRDADGYYTRKREARAQLGIEVIHHGSIDYTAFLLTVFNQSASRGSPEDVDIATLATRRVVEFWDGKLAAALEVLGLPQPIYPKSHRPEALTGPQKPRWLLASYWG